jgi:MFS family permease
MKREPLLVSEEWRTLRLRLRRWAVVSGLASVVLTGVVILTRFGAWAEISHRRGRHLLDIAWQLSSSVFLFSGGVLLWGWLVDRFGDRPKSEK